jgi:hypothetical protein
MFCRLTETPAEVGTAGRREWGAKAGDEGEVVVGCGFGIRRERVHRRIGTGKAVRACRWCQRSTVRIAPGMSKEENRGP